MAAPAQVPAEERDDKPDRDANDARAAIRLVLAQPSVSSQMVDNLNASIHLRALLTDLFLIDEIVRPEAEATPSANAPAE